jgi:hypothetical protein
MNRTLLVCALISASALGCASHQSRSDAQIAAASQAKPQPCQPELGSRIPGSATDCANPAKRTYSDADIRNTGQTNVGDALRQLDPSITVHN